MNYNNLDLEYFHQFTKGHGVRVAILDSEIDLSHREFEGRDIQYEEFIPSTQINYHGTAIASLIVGRDIGVAPEVSLYHMKMLSDVFGSGVSWGDAIRKAIRLDVDIICMSIGTKGELSPSMRQVLQTAKEKNITILAPSGNEGMFILRNPAADERVIAVGGRNAKGEKSEKSNKHPDIEAYAISENVLVANTGGNFKYVKKDGTSFANAIVTGQIALIVAYARDRGFEINVRDFMSFYNKRNPYELEMLNMDIIKKELDYYLDM